MKKIIQLLFIGVIGLSLKSCYYDEALPEPEIPVEEGLTFKADIAPILSACTSCHKSGSISPELSNTLVAYNKLFPNYVTKGDPSSSKLYTRASGNTTGTHPEVSVKLSATDLAYLKKWITDGAVYE